MGAQTSKVARKLPTKARPETLKNVPTESPATLASVVPPFAGMNCINYKKHNLNSHGRIKDRTHRRRRP